MSALATRYVRLMALRLLALPEHHVRFALGLLAMAEPREDALVVTTTGAQLTDQFGMSRGAVLRAIETLIKAGFVVVDATPGRGGESVITISCSDHSIDESYQSHETVNGRPPIINGRSFEIGAARSAEHPDSLRESLAALGDRGGINQPDPIIKTDHYAIQATDPSSPRARDLDLLRSPQKDQRSDLRSSDLEILTRSYGPAGSDPVETSDETSKPAKKTPRKRCDASRIPDRAWTAADYLRHMVLDRNGAAVVGMKPWKAGTTWVGGSSKGVKVDDGIGSREGLRLTWAEEFRLFHQTLSGAFKRNNTPDHENAAWSAIASTIQWLFHKQPPGCRFVVESPGSLSRKWDRIKAVRESSVTSSTAPLGNGRQSTLVRPKYEDRDPPTKLFETRRKT